MPLYKAVNLGFAGVNPIDQHPEFDRGPNPDLYQAGQDGAPDYQGLRTHYDLPDGGGTMGVWNEKIACILHPGDFMQDLEEGRLIDVGWVTSADVEARRAGKIDKSAFQNLAIIGVTRTIDGHVVIGQRGGDITLNRVTKIGAGLYGCPPGGSLTWLPEGDLIGKTLRQEVLTELGLTENLVGNVELIGCFEALQPGPMGIKIVAVVNTHRTFGEIYDLHAKGLELYRQFRYRQDLSHSGALQNFPESGCLATDAWEHTHLVGLLDTPEGIETFVSDHEDQFTGIGAGALMTYVAHCERED